MAKSPGKDYRIGLTVFEVMELFPDEQTARVWFEGQVWPYERHCGHCGSTHTREVPKAKPMPYWCSDCRSYFSVRTGTVLESTRIPLRKWAIAIYLELTSLKSVSSMKLHRDIGVRQATAWFMLHRIREAWNRDHEPFQGPVEVDETYMGGKKKNKHFNKKLKAGRGPDGKTAVLGAKYRDSNFVSAKVVQSTDKETLQGFVADNATATATVYTDDAKAYKGMPFEHESVNHSAGEYVRDQAHTNGVESFWSMLKRAYVGTFHKISPKHLNRYVQEFSGKHNVREMDTIEQMQHVVASFVGKRLMYRDLEKDNGLSSGARS